MKSKSLFWEREIFGITIVWIGFLLASVIGITYELYESNAYELHYGKQAWSNFVSIYDFPLKLTAAYFAAYSLLSINIRFKQTKQQLDVTTAQNRFTNYFKHLEEFEKYANTIDREVDSRIAHAQLFPNMIITGDIKVNMALVHDTLSDIDRALYSLTIHLNDKENAPFSNELATKQYRAIDSLTLPLSLSSGNDKLSISHLVYLEKQLTVHDCESITIDILKYANKYLSIVSFDPNMEFKEFNIYKDSINTLFSRLQAQKNSGYEEPDTGRFIYTPKSFSVEEYTKHIDAINLHSTLVKSRLMKF